MCSANSRVLWSFRAIVLILCLSTGIIQISAQDTDFSKTASKPLVVLKSPAETLLWLSQQWDDTTWNATRNSMRPADDRGWQARMLGVMFFN